MSSLQTLLATGDCSEHDLPMKDEGLPTKEPADWDQLRAWIRQFRDERDWGQFHNPKDMAIAISLEASELLEHFLWKSGDEVDARVQSHREAIKEEIADIAIYVTELADNLDIDLLQAMESKLRKNAAKYPADQVRGSAKKYTEYPEAES